MLKKILLTIILLTTIFSLNNLVAAECIYDSEFTNANNLASCGLGERLVEPWNVEIGSWKFKDSILIWIRNIAWFLGLIAVWSLVYAAFMMTISGWEEEKTKKAKDIVKWTILWFLWIVTASSLIAIIVNFMYSF